MENRGRAAIAAVIFLIACPCLFALPPALAAQAPSWFEASVSAAWSPARGSALFGWRFVFRLPDMPVALGVDCLLDDEGGYATFDATWLPALAGFPDSLSLPVTGGIGLSRRGEDISPALVIAGAAEWYPVSFAGSSGPWIMGLGVGAGASVYFVSWGFEPVLSTRLLVPGNLSAGD